MARPGWVVRRFSTRSCLYTVQANNVEEHLVISPDPSVRSDGGRPTTSTLRRVAIGVLALAAFFVFRLLYGLSREFFFEDPTQIFLMGLRWYATGDWPYFGPDVTWTDSQIPGALQPLLVGLPLVIAPVPEAPYVFLNLLSVAGLGLFAWYITARLPQLPKWLVWGWLMSLPWTLEFSTHVINPSYLLAPVLVFFIGFFEALPTFRLGKVPVPMAFLMMGAALGWVMQIHLSWPLLLPYIALAWALRVPEGRRTVALNTVAAVAGLLLFGSLLVPTFVVHGIGGGSGGTARNLRPHWVTADVALSTLARLFSFASLEIWRFIGTGGGNRTMFLFRHLWMVPLTIVVGAAGVWQPFW